MRHIASVQDRNFKVEKETPHSAVGLSLKDRLNCADCTGDHGMQPNFREENRRLGHAHVLIRKFIETNRIANQGSLRLSVGIR